MRDGGTFTDIPRVSRAEQYKRYNKSEKGRKRQSRYKIERGPDNYLSRPFIAYDGEGITVDDGSHLYTLFASSEGLFLQNDNGIPSVAIFDAILDSKCNHPEAIHVIYGGSYDFNMWLSDVPIERVNELYERGTTVWMHYKMQWRRGKSFTITNRLNGTSCIMYDVVSFFQRPFVQACDEYLTNDPNWQNVRDMIVANKALRGTFRAEDNADVQRYNQAELATLVNLMCELRERLHKVQLRPARWDGPGAIATALLQRERIKDHMSLCPLFVGEASRFAYFGGRFEMLKCGDVPMPAWEYDINSAYPSALRSVPSLVGGTWVQTVVPTGIEQFAVFQVHFERDDDWPVDRPHPFPCRFPDGRVWYPSRVTGWYWAPEVFIALASKAGRVTILDGWGYLPATDEKPFGFIEPMYRKRQALKKAGDGAHVGIKLGLNSLYGKTCQRIGWRINPDGTMRTPPFHQLEWAGYVTSHCRAHIYQAALQRPDDVIAFETDALFMREPLDLDIGPGLGQWEATEFESLAYAQSGFYFGVIGGEPFAKTRGIDRGSMTYSDVSNRFWSDESFVDASLTRFNGVGLARMRNKWETWRRWETTPKRISLVPTGKRVHFTEYCAQCLSGNVDDWHPCVVPWEHELVSSSFPIPWINPDEAMTALEEMRMTEDHADEMSLYYE